MTGDHQDLLGMRIERALDELRERGVDGVHITETCAPRGAHDAGHLRAVRIDNGGRSIVAARFPDEVEKNP